MKLPAVRILFALFIFLLPTQLGKHFFMEFSFINGVRVDYIAPTIYLMDILLISALLHIKLMLKKHILPKKNPYLATILILSGLNIAFSAEPLLALYIFYRFATVYLSYRLIRIYIRNNPRSITSTIFFTASIAAASIQLILTTMQFSYSRSMQGIFYYFGERYFTAVTPGIAKASFFGTEFLRPYGTFSHPNSLGGFYALMLAIALTRKTQSPLKPILILLSLMLILISFSKTAIIASVVILGVHGTKTLYKRFLTKQPLCIPCLIGRLIIIASVGALFVSTQSDPQNISKRIELAWQSLDILRQNFLLGVGLGHHLYAHALYNAPYPYFINQPVHNIFLLFTMQAGIPMTAITGIGLWKRTRTAILPLLVIIITGFMDHYWITLPQNMFLLGTGFALARKVR